MRPFSDQDLEDYILERLSESDSLALKSALAQNPDLQQRLREIQVNIDQAEHLGALKMKKKLEGIGEKFHQKRAEAARPRRMWWIAGAAAAAVLLFLTAQFFFLSSPSTQDLFAQHYQSYPLPFNQRSNEAADKKLIDAGSYYRKGDFQQAIPLLQELVTADSEDSRLYLALGISHLEAQEAPQAIEALAPLIARSDTLYLAQAHWYTALAHLQLADVFSCKKELQWLATQAEGFKKIEAVQLLKELE